MHPLPVVLLLQYCCCTKTKHEVTHQLDSNVMSFQCNWFSAVIDKL